MTSKDNPTLSTTMLFHMSFLNLSDAAVLLDTCAPPLLLTVVMRAGCMFCLGAGFSSPTHTQATASARALPSESLSHAYRDGGIPD